MIRNNLSGEFCSGYSLPGGFDASGALRSCSMIEEEHASEVPPTPKSRGSEAEAAVLVESDLLRKGLADVIENAARPGLDVTPLLDLLRDQFDSPEVWDAALRSTYVDESTNQDIPIVESACRDLPGLIDSFLSIQPWSDEDRSSLLQAPGRYGRTALEHAISFGKYKSADKVIRHGAFLGMTGDRTAVINGIIRAGREARQKANSWSAADKAVRRMYSTLNTLYGDNWVINYSGKETSMKRPEHDFSQSASFVSRNFSLRESNSVSSLASYPFNTWTVNCSRSLTPSVGSLGSCNSGKIAIYRTNSHSTGGTTTKTESGTQTEPGGNT